MGIPICDRARTVAVLMAARRGLPQLTAQDKLALEAIAHLARLYVDGDPVARAVVVPALRCTLAAMQSTTRSAALVALEHVVERDATALWNLVVA